MPHTKPRVATAHAIAAYLARRSLALATLIYLVALAVLVAIIWSLAHYFNDWWWLFAIPLAFITLVAFALRLVLLLIITKIYRHPFNRVQREKLEEFTDKIASLAETSSTPLPFYAFITIWDIFRRRDATTVRKLIDNSRSLKGDYTALEKYFGEH